MIKHDTNLLSSGYNVRRIAGATRFETAVLVAEQLKQLKGTPSVIYAAYSHNYPDALAVSSVAGASGCPIVYVPDKGTVDANTASFIQASPGSGIVILGGTAAVGEDIANQLSTLSGNVPERIAGADRYGTALAVCRKYDSILTGSGVAFATGSSFPDALAGGAFAAKERIPVILVNKTGRIDGAYEYITSRSHDTKYVFGGTSAVSDDALTAILSSPLSSTASTISPATSTTSTQSTSSTTSTTSTESTSVTSSSILPTSSTTTTIVRYSPAGQYIGNKNSKVFHRPDCGHLPLQKNRVYFDTRSEAVGHGYSPCNICNP